MDEAVGDLKQALPCVVESPAVHVEVLQRSSRNVQSVSIVDTELKVKDPQLLDYVMTALLFSDKNVDSNLITWNRVVLLHVNYKLALLIRMLWFQSGKLVTRMFQKIQDLIDDKEALVFVLIDEVGTHRKSEGLSGRVLRKLPFLAHALYIQAPSVTIEGFLQALSLAVDKQFEEKKKLSAYV
ncbi:hypothetical protein A6R68_19635 [Neotoma lepida]|uniref:Pachytene checkpoint protein 2 homolog n=1 Tax=Neotoma lepida TaxID=56216 RepID=A0A1A6HI78_NEOLE|nr:hypothetical protein A6R68_19635 [Neotoma lepida]